MTFLSIIYAYFSDSLPSWYLNDVDAAFMAAYEASWLSRKDVARIQRAWNKCAQSIRQRILGSRGGVARKSLSRTARSKAVASFMLALSDQQLVTGLAIHIGALATRCRISAYEFRVVFSLS